MSKKKLSILLIVFANIGFVWAVFNMFYYKQASFDTSKKASISIYNINKIHNGDGSWIWNKKEYDFYKEHSFSLSKKEISEFCKIINSSNAQYIENIRPKKWLDINVEEKNSNSRLITLKQSDKDEIYFEFENNIFNGKELEKFIYKHTKTNKIE